MTNAGDIWSKIPELFQINPLVAGLVLLGLHRSDVRMFDSD